MVELETEMVFVSPVEDFIWSKLDRVHFYPQNTGLIHVGSHLKALIKRMSIFPTLNYR